MSLSPPELVCLPQPNFRGSMSLEETIFRRRSVRFFLPDPLTQEQLSQILWAAQGITHVLDRYRSAPSAGATFPIETFVACGQHTIDGMSAGVYRYNNGNHSLSLRYSGDIREELAAAATNQQFICEAPLDIVLTAEYRRTVSRYGERGERYVHTEIGHVAQNICLQATALNLGTVSIGAFNDESVKAALRVGERFQPLYIMPVGKPG